MRALLGRVVLALSASAVVILANAAGAGASPRSAKPPSLTGETLNATTDTADFFDRTSGTHMFSFAGTASGPYSGTFTETGTVSYELTRFGEGHEADGPITAFSASFAITSPSGTVTGNAQASDGTVGCRGGIGGGGCWTGTSFGPSPLATSYVATIRTAHGHHRDRGTSSITLIGGEIGEENPPVFTSSLDQSFSSDKHLHG